MTISLSTAVEITKRTYPNGQIAALYKNFPTLALAKKRTDFRGEGEYLLWKYAPGAGGSSAFANAQTNASAGSRLRPFIQRKKEYGIGAVDGEMWEASQGDKYAVVRAFNEASADADYNIERALAVSLFGNGGGARAKVAAYTATQSVCTLQNEFQVRNFEVGMVVQASTADGTSGALKDSGNTFTVTALDVTAKTVTSGSALDTQITGFATNDYLFRQGDFGNVMTGLFTMEQGGTSKNGWVPVTAPTSGDSHFGADRSANVVRNAGFRYAPGSGQIEEVLQDFLAQIAAYSTGVPDMLIMNPVDVSNLTKEWTSRTTTNLPTDVAKIGVKAIQYMTPVGEVSIIVEPNCPRFRVCAGVRGQLQLWSAGAFPKILMEDGNTVLRKTSADEYELRKGGYAQWVIPDLRGWGVCTLPS